MNQSRVFHTHAHRAAAINKEEDRRRRGKRQKKQQQKRNTGQEDDVLRRVQRTENGLRSLQTKYEATLAQLAASQAVTEKLTAKLAAREVTVVPEQSVKDEQQSDEQEQEYEVDKVLGMEEDGMFKVLWKIAPGQTKADVTWEPAENLRNATEKIRIYLDDVLKPLGMFTISKNIVNVIRMSETMSFVNGRRTQHVAQPFVRVLGRAPHKMITTGLVSRAQSASGGQEMVRREFKDGKYRRVD
jgi:hypothetical protein